MRVPVIIFFELTIFIMAAAVCAPAEVIRLKNGGTIWAEQVREKGTHIEYQIGDNSYAIPKSSVKHIDGGGIPPQSLPPTGDADLSAFAPSDSLDSKGNLSAKILHDDRIDSDALADMEKSGNAELVATAYFIAGKHEFEQGDVKEARRYYETALRFQSNNSTILNYYAALLVRTGNAAEALTYAERSARVAPDSADALTILGFAQFTADRTREAIRSWKKSLAMRPDAKVEQFLAKAEREATAEAEFSQRESSHFTLRFEGKQTSESLRRELLATLESEYDELVRQLAASPRSSIPVVLYTERAFFDVTHAPSWTGAVNDGKLRIPISGITSVTPELARVLKHELAHSFIDQISAGRCPQWLHEGIAQLLEPKTTDARGHRLAQVFRAQREIPFYVLEDGFMRFSKVEAVLAYDESLAAAEYISDTYGLSDLQRILDRIGQGSSTEAALRATIHCSYGELETEVGKYLSRRYSD